MEKGVWKPIKELPGYWVSTAGAVKHVYPSGKERILKTYVKKPKKGSRYMLVKPKKTPYKISHLVYTTFKGEIPKGCNIVHINGDYTDNSINNLKAISPRETGEKYGGKGRRKGVIQFDKFGNAIQAFPSCRAAARASGISYTTISANCNKVYGWLAADGKHYEWDESIEY